VKKEKKERGVRGENGDGRTFRWEATFEKKKVKKKKGMERRKMKTPARRLVRVTCWSRVRTEGDSTGKGRKGKKVKGGETNGL